MPDYIWVKNDQGAEYAVVASAFDPEIHTEVDGARVALDANGLPRLADDGPTAPAKSDNKQAWVDYAVTQGADPAEAEAMTKADLINQYDKEQ